MGFAIRSLRFKGGLGFGVWGLGFGVWGLGFGVWNLGFGVWGFEFGVYPMPFSFLRFTVSQFAPLLPGSRLGFGVGVQAPFDFIFEGFGFRVYDLGLRVEVSGSRVVYSSSGGSRERDYLALPDLICDLQSDHFVAKS